MTSVINEIGYLMSKKINHKVVNKLSPCILLQYLNSIFSYLNLIDIVMKLILWTIIGKYLIEEIFEL